MALRCPRVDCPNPTLYVARVGSKYHCIGCWRKFTLGGRNLPVLQERPPKRWLRAYSLGRVHGPPPALVHARLIVRLRMRPAHAQPAAREPSAPRQVSITAESYNWPSSTNSSSSVEDDDVVSTGATTGRTEDIDEDCESTGSSPDEHIPIESTTMRALNLTYSGRKFVMCCGGAPVLT